MGGFAIVVVTGEHVGTLGEHITGREPSGVDGLRPGRGRVDRHAHRAAARSPGAVAGRRRPSAGSATIVASSA